MSAATIPALVLESTTAAEHLRLTAAAVRVHFTWWGLQRTLTNQQKEEVSDACGADARLLSFRHGHDERSPEPPAVPLLTRTINLHP